jgi:hypothetical protein
VLYDSVAGGAGYCQMLTARFSMRDLLKNALEVLRCKAECCNASQLGVATAIPSRRIVLWAKIRVPLTSRVARRGLA